MSEGTQFLGSEFVSRETNEHFEMLEKLVQKWNPAINLVSKESLRHLRDRHINDSLQLFNLATFGAGTWCDLGSGGGFPGLVVAILMKTTKHPGHVKLIEADARKCTFLREAARQMEVEATIVNERIEQLAPLSASILSARALTALPQLCEFADQHLASDGVALFPKGARYQEEVDAARKSWSFDLTVHPSKTESSAAILELRNVHHV